MASSELFYEAPPDVEAKILFLAKFPLPSALPLFQSLQVYLDTGALHQRKRLLAALISAIADIFNHFDCNELVYSEDMHSCTFDKHTYRRYEFDGHGCAQVEGVSLFTSPTKWSKGIDLFVTGHQIAQANKNLDVGYCAWLPNSMLQMSFRGQRGGIPLEAEIPWSRSQ
jgi:hypothetical protein